MVRAKFRVNKIEISEGMRRTAGSGTREDPYKYGPTELRTVVMAPVYSDDPNSENRKFWEASPSGEIRLGTINPEAWAPFHIGGEVYIDFTPAETEER
jgi:hypothetical protein